MIRNKFLLILTSLFLLGAMTFIDTRHYYLESEELVESREAEREELKEGAEGKDWMKWVHGGFDFYAKNQSFRFPPLTHFHGQTNAPKNIFFNKKELPLFLKYCCLKLNL
ncbi:MAG: hypothetical protein ABJG47_09675 [Ekhidna sp.]